MWVLILVMLIQLQTGVVMLCLPLMERRGFVFGKRTDETPEIARIRGQWRSMVGAITLACMGGTLAAGPARPLWWIALCMLQSAGLAVSWAMLRTRFKPTTPAPIDMNVRSGFIKRPPDPSRNVVRALMWGPLLLIVIAAIVLALNWGNIPERFPIHINARGVIDNWGDRSWRTLLRLPLLAMLIWFVLIINWVMDAFAYMPPRRRFGFELVIAGVMWDAVLTLCAAHVLSPFIAIKSLVAIIVILATAGQFVIFLIFLAIWLKVSPRLAEDPPPTPAEIDREDDRFWHWYGYNNPDDPALWVEKRVGVGPTPNMAHVPPKLILAFAVLYVLFFAAWFVTFA